MTPLNGHANGMYLSVAHSIANTVCIVCTRAMQVNDECSYTDGGIHCNCPFYCLSRTLSLVTNFIWINTKKIVTSRSIIYERRIWISCRKRNYCLLIVSWNVCATNTSTHSYSMTCDSVWYHLVFHCKYEISDNNYIHSTVAVIGHSSRINATFLNLRVIILICDDLPEIHSLYSVFIRNMDWSLRATIERLQTWGSMTQEPHLFSTFHATTIHHKISSRASCLCVSVCSIVGMFLRAEKLCQCRSSPPSVDAVIMSSST